MKQSGAAKFAAIRRASSLLSNFDCLFYTA
jgi:hypothetical protein